MVKANEERYEFVTILGHPALFTSLRIQPDSIPEGMQRYEIRHEDDNGMAAAQLGRGIWVNHMGTLLTRADIPLDERGFRDIEADALVFSNRSIRELEAFMQQFPLPGRVLDAAKEVFEERTLGYSEGEAVLYHPGVIDFSTVPDELQVLYAYEGEDEYGLQLFAPGKTVPAALPFEGTYISVKGASSLIVATDGQSSICYREIFSGRGSNLSLKDYMREQNLPVGNTKKKQEQER